MALKILKKTKAAEVAIPKAKQSSEGILDPDVVDDYASRRLLLEHELAKFTEEQKALGAMEDEFRDLVDEIVPPTEDCVVHGSEHILEFSAKAVQNDIDTAAARKLRGDKVFFLIAKLSVTDLRKYLSPDELEQVLIPNPSKKRRIKIT